MGGNNIMHWVSNDSIQWVSNIIMQTAPQFVHPVVGGFNKIWKSSQWGTMDPGYYRYNIMVIKNINIWLKKHEDESTHNSNVTIITNNLE